MGGAGLFLALSGCQPPRASGPEPPAPFLDVAEQAGIRFRHETGARGRYHLPETMGAGCAFFDYDGDGWTDIYLMQSGALPGDPPLAGAQSRLFRNTGSGSFEEVPGAAGLDGPGYGMGCCAADIDNDGDLDVFTTSYGGVALYRNDGGRFRNVTEAAGVATSGWGASAAFGDYDRDGFVDLFISRYVEYDLRTAASCNTPRGGLGYCPPEVFPATTDRLFRNRGNGTFEDVTARSGVGSVQTRGLGVVFLDYDRDGFPDIFVACDQSPNVLWHNQGNGTFRNRAVEAAVAFDNGGRIMNGMGVDFSDTDHDGDMDGVVANFSGQPNSFFRNLGGSGGFEFRSTESGLGIPSVPLLGFGCNFLDFDGDGWDDLFVANGHVNDAIAESVPGVTYAQPASLYQNRDGSFRPVPEQPGKSLWRSRVSRGSAVADYDRDGAPDLLVTNSGEKAELFRNQAQLGKRWLTVRLEGRRSNRAGIGALVSITTDTVQTREVRAGSSYLSQNDLALTFGLGTTEVARKVAVTWPSGRSSRLENVPGGQVLLVREPEK